MTRTHRLGFVCFLLLVATVAASAQQSPSAKPRRNVIIFVADGLRHGSVNEKDTPALWRVRTEGVHFRNSYSVFPTFTTANAATIATGHHIGDTGDFSNSIWVGHATYDSGNYNLAPGTPVPFIENDQAIGDLNSHFGGNYLSEETFLGLARKNGFNTAALGKIGPTGIQDATSLTPVNGNMPPPTAAIIIDDATGTASGAALPPRILAALLKEKIPPETPARTNGFGANSQYSNGYSGDRSHPGTLAPNTLQQKWMADVTTRAILPTFVADDKPFALVFWSRDPDATQHNEGDSLNSMSPGINGESSLAGVRNADATLGQILRWLDDHAAIKDNTDVVVTSDHGFATIARKEIDRLGHASQAESAQHYYFDTTGRVDTDKGTLPTGFLAIDLAVALKTKLWDPDRRGPETSRFPFRQVRLDSDAWEHPQNGNGLLGSRIAKPDGSDADVIVAANGGSDLIYVPDGNRERIQKVVDIVLQFDYVGAVFVDDRFAPIAGTLPLSAINLIGATKMPRPTIVVAFRTFYLDPNDLQSGIQISDTSLQEGQGMHGGFGRDQTYNNMAAFGPDFKRGFVDDAPVSNADIVPTLANILGFALKPNGKLSGRVVREALNGGQAQTAPLQTKTLTSDPAHGKQTVLRYQEMDGLRYLHSAELVGPK